MTLLTITSSKHVTPVFFCEKLVPKDQRSMFKRNFTNLKFTNAQNGQCKCHKMLLLHLSCFIVVSCLSSQYVCYSCIHYCTKFQTGKKMIKSLCVLSYVNIWDNFSVLYMSLLDLLDFDLYIYCPSKGCFSCWWPLLGARKLAPKKRKSNFFSKKSSVL